MKMITVANPKGGSGKTTTAVELSTLLALQGFSVLLIDLDCRQEALASCQTRPDNLVLATDFGPVAAAYDFIFVDTPTEKNDLTEKAFILSDAVLVPVSFSFSAIRVAKEFVQELSLPYWAIATHFRPRTRFSTTYWAKIQEAFGSKVLRTPIHSSVKFAEASALGTPLALMETEARALEDWRNVKEIFLNELNPNIQMRTKDLSVFHLPKPVPIAARKELSPEEGVNLGDFDDLMKDI